MRSVAAPVIHTANAWETEMDASAQGSIIRVVTALDPGMASATLDMTMTEADAIQHDNEAAMAFILMED